VEEISSNANTYVVDLDEKGVGMNGFGSADIFSSIRVIPLENHSESLFGELTSMQIYDGNLVILDAHKSKSLFVFDREGKFLRRIGRTGAGPGEYLKPIDFTIDKMNDEIFVLDAAQFINVYNVRTGLYKRTLSIREPGTVVRYIQMENGTLYSDRYVFEPSHSDPLLQSIDVETGHCKALYLNAAKYNCGWNELYATQYGFFSGRSTSSPVFFQVFMNTIIKMDGGKLFPYVVLKSRDLTTNKDLQDVDLNSLNEYLFSNKKVYNIQAYFENDSIILFSYNRGNSNQSVVINKLTEEIKLGQVSNNLLYKSKARWTLPIDFVAFDESGGYLYVDDIFKPYLRQAIADGVIHPSVSFNDAALAALADDSNSLILHYINR
jgi:hypothetical protein